MHNRIIAVKNPINDTISIIHPAQEMLDPDSRTRQYLEFMGITFNDREEVFSYILEKDIPTYRTLMLNGETEMMAKVRLSTDDLDRKLPYRVTTKDNLPADRDFRNAWTDDNPTDTVDVDIVKARGIHMRTLRQLRNGKLVELDAAYFLDDETGDSDKQAEIAALKL